MPLKDEIESEVRDIFRGIWKTRDGKVVPDETSIGLGNDGVKLEATVLYADLSDSTKLVDSYPAEFAAEIYNAFLRCAAKIIRNDGGTITAYDGDRIMAIFMGDYKNNAAARVGLKIHYACMHIIQPAIKIQYPNRAFVLKHVVGIDTSDLLVTKTGVRGANDLLWMGKASNHAAKLCELDHDYPTWITKVVFDNLVQANKTAQDGRAMWEERLWTNMNNAQIYRSNWWWSI
jgi:class 3 adenylate cyclase